MTKPIPEGGPRKRPARSCLACRTSKLKCLEGVGPDEGEAVQKCTRCAKTGGACLWASSKRTGRPRPHGRMGSATADGDGDGERSSGDDDDNARASSPALVGSPDLSWFLAAPPSPALAAPLPLPTRIPRSPLSNAHSPAPNDVAALATAYLSLIHPFVPLLPDRHADLVAYLGAATPLLTLAIHSLLDGPDAVSPPALANLGTTIAECQAAVFFLHAAYSRGREDEAREILAWLSTTVVRAGWHIVDMPGQVFELDPRYRKAIRSLWWETWGLEIMLGTVTGIRTTVLLELSHQVHTSDSPDDNDSPLALRARALALLASATKPPPDDAAEESTRAEALHNVSNNLSLITHQSYLTSCAAFSVASPEDHPRIAADCEAAFMASLITSAATIFLLTSSSHFSSFIAPFSPCGLDTSTAPPLNTHPLLRAASSHIFTLIRTSLSLAPSVPPPTHSAFFGCSLLVAAQGTLLTLQSEQSGWRSVQVLSDIELAEYVLGVQAKRWSVAANVLGQVKALKAATFGAVGLGSQLLVQ